MPGQAIIVVGASAGGVEALLTLAEVVPPDLPAAVLVVLHTSARPSTLPRLLSRRGPLPADQATDGAPLQPGRIYVAPGDHHLLVARGHLHVVQGPQENGFCPAVDPLFRSAAEAYGPHVIGVILSGYLDDGTAGLLAVKRHGGLAVVQDPDEAFAPGMPRSALAYVAVDYTLPLASMGPLLGRLAAAVAEGAEQMPNARQRWHRRTTGCWTSRTEGRGPQRRSPAPSAAAFYPRCATAGCCASDAKWVTGSRLGASWRISRRRWGTRCGAR